LPIDSSSLDQFSLDPFFGGEDVLHLLVLGAAAGGGFPQWNSNDAAARRLRGGDPKLRPLTQSSIAVSADHKRWVICDAAPDIRQQIIERSQLHPAADGPMRASPIASVILTSADIDHVAGLLTLRESQAFTLYAHQRVLNALASNTIFNALDPHCVMRRALPLDEGVAIAEHSGASLGIQIKAFGVPGKAPLWLENPAAPGFGTEIGDTIGLEIRADGSPPLFYIPGCASMTAELAARLRGAALVLFDGTLWRDDEMIVAGVGKKTGKRMGHMSCSGPDGTIQAFADLGVARRIFIHMNNTNPLLLPDSPERREAEKAGWEIAYDGMEIGL
jgi:pyrroloquinoline quinone biosynthesis protein B